jgi:hypothetical protein
VLTSGRARAQYYGEEPEISLYGYRDHTGMFSHVGLGLGYAAANADFAYDPGRDDLSQSGVAYQLHFALGGSVMPGLAVHFSFFGFDSFGTSLKTNGREVRGVDADVSLSGLGAGVTYYLPSNLYLSGAFGLGLVSATDSTGLGQRLNPGIAAQLGVGYEFWVTSQWGLGMTLAGTYFRATDDTTAGDETWQGFAVAPMFSATMN